MTRPSISSFSLPTTPSKKRSAAITTTPSYRSGCAMKCAPGSSRWSRPPSNIAPRTRVQAQKELQKKLTDICSRHGLTPAFENSSLVDETVWKTLTDYTLTQMGQRITRKKDGRPAGREVVARWLQAKKSESLTTGLIRVQEESSLFTRALDKTIDSKYGKNALEMKFAALGTKVFGLYVPAFLASVDFDYVHTMPGHVVETNGQLVGDNRVRWQFNACAAWPHGYRMECRALMVKPEMQKILMPGRPLLDRQAMLDFTALVSGREKLIDALRKCIEQKKMGPLHEYRKSLSGKPNPAEEIRALDNLLVYLATPAE